MTYEGTTNPMLGYQDSSMDNNIIVLKEELNKAEEDALWDIHEQHQEETGAWAERLAYVRAARAMRQAEQQPKAA